MNDEELLSTNRLQDLRSLWDAERRMSDAVKALELAENALACVRRGEGIWDRAPAVRKQLEELRKALEDVARTVEREKRKPYTVRHCDREDPVDLRPPWVVEGPGKVALAYVKTETEAARLAYDLNCRAGYDR